MCGDVRAALKDTCRPKHRALDEALLPLRSSVTFSLSFREASVVLECMAFGVIALVQAAKAQYDRKQRLFVGA